MAESWIVLSTGFVQHINLKSPAKESSKEPSVSSTNFEVRNPKIPDFFAASALASSAAA